MPTLGLEHPPDDIAWEIPISGRYKFTAVSTHIYLAGALFVALIALRLLHARWRTFRTETPLPAFSASEEKHNSAQSLPRSSWQKGRQAPEANWGRGIAPPRAVPSQPGLLGKLPAMDGDKGKPGEDHYPWSALAASRGVSNRSPKLPHDASGFSPSSPTITGRSGRSRSPRASSRPSPGTCHRGSPDGTESQLSRDKGKGPMAGSSGHMGDGSKVMEQEWDVGSSAMPADNGQAAGFSFQEPLLQETDARIPRHFTRPPPPPSLTPPTLSGTFFPFEDRRPSYAVSIPPSLDMSFIHQPNPEYGGYSTSAEAPSSSPQHATSLPRRKSYTRSVPIGIPVPTTTASASSSTETMTSGSSTTNTFSPSSYPPTSPLLPPPPPGQYELPPSAPPEYEFVGGPGGPGVFFSQQEIDMQGEIISVVDDAGHGWKRHTRVYGGGVCLACVAAAGRDGGQGGFYGDKVPLEDRR